VEPNDPNIWTDQTKPPPITRVLVAATFLFPIVVIALVVSLLLHKRALAIWASGDAQPAIVVDTKTSALAPLSQLVRCTLRSESDPGLWSVTVPHRYGKFRKGEAIWIITAPGGARRALAAKVFQS
ncbi:MAG TPA: hypothetical protein VGI75_05795, partial [Pirellulales bacterium]